MVKIFGISKAEADRVKVQVRNDDKDADKMRDTRSDRTPDAVKKPAAKRKAAKKQFDKADKKNAPETEEAAPEVNDANKARDAAEKARVKAKAEAMKPSTPEEQAAAAARLAVTGF